MARVPASRMGSLTYVKSDWATKPMYLIARLSFSSIFSMRQKVQPPLLAKKLKPLQLLAIFYLLCDCTHWVIAVNLTYCIRLKELKYTATDSEQHGDVSC